MTSIFEELDFQKTPLGEISLRRRSEPRLDNIVLYEVKLGDEFLMSSLFVEAEVQLANLGLEALERNLVKPETGFDVVVGGLGLGYTAAAALKYPSLGSLRVVEVMEPVIDWHRNGLVPLGPELHADQRCELIQGDFFAITASDHGGFYASNPNQLAHGVLLDIDHSPSHWLNPQNQSLYTQSGLSRLSTKLHSGGLFGVWSNDPPEPEFCKLLESVFSTSRADVVTFANPYTGGESSNTVYLAHTY